MSFACRVVFLALALGLVVGTPVGADTMQYTASAASYPTVTAALAAQFGSSANAAETTLTAYQAQGPGLVDLTFHFQLDSGAFLFSFGFFPVTPTLAALDTSTDAGRRAYAALALGNATLVFDNRTDIPGASRSFTLPGGTVLGLFLIPDASLAVFQGNPGGFDVNGLGSATFHVSSPLRWPLFGDPDANPGSRDQLLSFSGTSALTGQPTNLFAWEDLTRASIAGNRNPSDTDFNDLIFTVEGRLIPTDPPPASVPEPSTFVLLAAGALALAARRRPT